MTATVKIAVAGALGRMGQAVPARWTAMRAR